MRTHIGTLAILLLGATASSCGGARATPVTGSGGFGKYVGVYRFEERVSPELFLEGRFSVQPDTIEVETKTGICHVEPLASQVQTLTYSCGSDIRLSFDRLQPVVRASYVAQIMVTETRSVCARYVTNTAGQQVCAEYRRETYTRAATKSGRLRPQRLENAEWGAQ